MRVARVLGRPLARRSSGGSGGSGGADWKSWLGYDGAIRSLNLLMRKMPGKGPDDGKPADELAPIWTHIPSRVPHTHDEHAPISDKPATSVFNRYADLNVEETPSEEEDGESSQIKFWDASQNQKVPIEEFIRPTNRS